jgi:hypothetical protein
MQIMEITEESFNTLCTVSTSVYGGNHEMQTRDMSISAPATVRVTKETIQTSEVSQPGKALTRESSGRPLL